MKKVVITSICLGSMFFSTGSLAALTQNGLSLNGCSFNGLSTNRLTLNGINVNGVGLNGINVNGVKLNGINVNGVGINGINVNGVGINGITLNGIQPNNMGTHELPYLNYFNGLPQPVFNNGFNGINMHGLMSKKNEVLPVWYPPVWYPHY
jgi:mRNA guanylyltransferase